MFFWVDVCARFGCHSAVSQWRSDHARGSFLLCGYWSLQLAGYIPDRFHFPSALLPPCFRYIIASVVEKGFQTKNRNRSVESLCPCRRRRQGRNRSSRTVSSSILFSCPTSCGGGGDRSRSVWRSRRLPSGGGWSTIAASPTMHSAPPFTWTTSLR